MRSTMALLLVLLAAAPAFAQAVPDKELADLGKGIEESLAKQDPKYLDDRFEHRMFVERAMTGMKLPDKTLADLERFSRDWKPGEWVLGGGKPTYKLVKAANRSGEGRIIFRMIAENGSWSFHEWVVRMGPDGHGKLVDLLNYSTGEMRSNRKRHDWIVSLDPKLLAKAGHPLDDHEKEYARAVADVAKLVECDKADKGKDGLEIFGKLPKVVKEMHHVQLARWNCACIVGGKEPEAAAEDLVRLFGDDPDMDLLLVGAHSARKEHAEALACVERLLQRTGPDGYLETKRAKLLRAAGKPLADQKASAKKASEVDPKYADPVWILVEVSLAENDHAETARLLARLEREIGAKIPDVTTAKAYAGFVKSKEYAEWQKSRPSK